MLRALLRNVLKISAILLMGYAAFIIIKWYIYWLQYYFIVNLKIALLAGLATFFMAPIAAIADLFWHSLPDATVETCKFFLIYFIAGRILFFLGEKFDEIR